VKYRIVAMQGSEAKPVPLPGVAPLTTDAVIARPHYRSIDAYFNRGILSTQALAKMIGGKAKAGPSVTALKTAIADPKSKVRAMLAGQLEPRCSRCSSSARRGWRLLCALYEASPTTR